MEYINVRQLLNKYEGILTLLPVTVTRWGKPIFEIWPIGSVGKKEGILTREAKMPDKTVKVVPDTTLDATDLAVVETCTYGNCGELANASGKIWVAGSMEWMDSPMCPKHAMASLKEYLNG